jgi:nucleoside phosphorylase
MLRAVKRLEALEIEGKRPWIQFIEQAMHQLPHAVRPPNDMDILLDSDNPKKVIPHPYDRKRTEGQPRIFSGPIASANTLLKDVVERDILRDKFGVKAVEMEGSGIADATWSHEIGYLVVRGICDYCDANKGDVWQDYAAVVAAAYTRALLESIPT